MSGVVVGATSYATLSLGGGILALLLVPAVVWHRTAQQRDVDPAR